jgi:hypothetical protein
MAVVGTVEHIGTFSGEHRSGVTYDRSFTVRVSTPDTPLLEIAQAPGVRLGDHHPADAWVICKSFDVKPRGGAELLFTVSFKYAPPELADDGGAAALPADVWSGGTSIQNVGVYRDRDNKVMVNSAGTVFPDITKDQSEYQLSLTRCYAEAAFAAMGADIITYTNAINSDAWAGGTARQWKCQGAKWSKKVEADRSGARLAYYEATWEFAWRSSWQFIAIDRGYMELRDGVQKAIIGQDGKPVKEQVPLEPSGLAYFGSVDGVTYPKTKTFDLYKELSFVAKFGAPK